MESLTKIKVKFKNMTIREKEEYIKKRIIQTGTILEDQALSDKIEKKVIYETELPSWFLHSIWMALDIIKEEFGEEERKKLNQFLKFLCNVIEDADDSLKEKAIISFTMIQNTEETFEDKYSTPF